MIRNWASPVGRVIALALFSVVFFTVTGCSVTREHHSATPEAQRREIDADVNAALSKLYSAAPRSRELIRRSSGVLVFPSVVGGSFVVGGEYGRGALREGGVTKGYYSLGGGSVGLQIGAQSRAVILVFTNRQSLQKFKSSKGWSVGADASVHLATIGASGDIDSSVVNEPVVGFVLTNVGLSGGVSLKGSKVSPLRF